MKCWLLALIILLLLFTFPNMSIQKQQYWQYKIYISELSKRKKDTQSSFERTTWNRVFDFDHTIFMVHRRQTKVLSTQHVVSVEYLKLLYFDFDSVFVSEWYFGSLESSFDNVLWFSSAFPAFQSFLHRFVDSARKQNANELTPCCTTNNMYA